MMWRTHWGTYWEPNENPLGTFLNSGITLGTGEKWGKKSFPPKT